MQDQGEGSDDPLRRPVAPSPRPAPQHSALPPTAEPKGAGSVPGVGMWLGMLALAVLLAVAVGTVALVLLEARSGDGDRAVPTLVPSPDTSTPAAPTQSPAASFSSRPRASGTVAPVAGGSGWALPERQWDPLPQPDPGSPLFAAQVTALDDLAPVSLRGCPEPAVTPDEKAWKQAVRAQWSCVHAAWVPVFQKLGWPTVEPEVNFYPGEGSKSECGYLTAPAFYCSSGQGSVFFGGEHFEMAKDWDLAVNEMVNHEYGHHLQKLAGITAAKLSLPATNENERRAELQATCWSAMMTFHNQSFGFNGDDLATWNQRLDAMREDSLHGSRASLRYWGTRGLYAGTVGDCNTWVALTDDVA